MTRTERRLQTQSELDRLSQKVKSAPRGEIVAWRKWHVRQNAAILRKEVMG